MTGIGGCRSSGVLSSSAIVSNEGAKLVSIHFVAMVNSGQVIIKVFNGRDNSGVEVYRFNHMVDGFYNLEADMHGVLCRNGIYLEITATGSSTAHVSVEFN